ncbi:Transcription-associated protein 1 [Porphyridium purpureum]|uniref:Transcription-associated protein 1 n=1 Tax=Porphyridium purpureum TaxID=35688 RepID=A0A5J4YQ34_PORPP|nr:Transcription-associated protein 1 [Porphyridium purpureum]|eukprot:POR9313..scf236_6
MLTSTAFEAHSQELSSQQTSPQRRLQLLTEIRDSIEIVHTAEYRRFLRRFISVFKKVLDHLIPPQEVDGIDQKSRHLVLEILNRLPHIEVTRPYVVEILQIAMTALKSENEDNAIICLKIIFDLHKSYRGTLEEHVQPILDFVKEVYSNFPRTVQTLFSAGASGAGGAHQAAQAGAAGGLSVGVASLVGTAATGAGSNNATGGTTRLLKSTCSFKVVTECPLIVMFLSQLYARTVTSSVRTLIPLMVRATELQVPAGPMRNRNTLHDLIAAQVKTVSFLSFVLKQFNDLLRPYERSIPQSVVQLLLSCPADAVPIRRELLIATRHILAADFRAAFYSQIDLLLDEKVLIGTGRQAHESLRPLAYSFLAELVHYVRLNLSLPHLGRIIYLFSTNVHDPTLNPHIQTTSVRLLLNLIEGLLNKSDTDPKARVLLVRIMDTMVSKYVAMRRSVPLLIERVKKAAAEVKELKEKEPNNSSSKQQSPSASGTGTGTSTPLSHGGGGIASEYRSPEDPLATLHKEYHDTKALLKTLTMGLKTVVWSASNTPVALPAVRKTRIDGTTDATAGAGAGAGASTALTAPGPIKEKGLSEEECAMLADLLDAFPGCIELYRETVAAAASLLGSTLEGTSSSGRSSLVETAKAEEKEIVDQFAQIFTVLEPKNFLSLFSTRVGALFDLNSTNQATLMIQQQFLSSSNISRYFATILGNFLVSRLDELDEGGGPLNVVISGRSKSVGSGRDVRGGQRGQQRQQRVEENQEEAQRQARDTDDRPKDQLNGQELHDRLRAKNETTRLPIRGTGKQDKAARKDGEKGEMTTSTAPVTELSRSQALLRLFKILFASVTVFPENESALRLHVGTLVNGCLTGISRIDADPVHYLQLLRALFKSLAGGRNDPIYKEIMPLVANTLTTLMHSLNGPHGEKYRDLMLELCLTIPARPSTLLPCLSLHIQPIAEALKCSNELTSLALRTLEFWVDTLHPEFLQGLLSKVEPQLSYGLWEHARPGTTGFGMTCVRILGKMGAANRDKHLQNCMQVRADDTQRNLPPVGCAPSVTAELAWDCEGMHSCGVSMKMDYFVAFCRSIFSSQAALSNAGSGFGLGFLPGNSSAPSSTALLEQKVHAYKLLVSIYQAFRNADVATSAALRGKSSPHHGDSARKRNELEDSKGGSGRNVSLATVAAASAARSLPGAGKQVALDLCKCLVVCCTDADIKSAWSGSAHVDTSSSDSAPLEPPDVHVGREAVRFEKDDSLPPPDAFMLSVIAMYARQVMAGGSSGDLDEWKDAMCPGRNTADLFDSSSSVQASEVNISAGTFVTACIESLSETSVSTSVYASDLLDEFVAQLLKVHSELQGESELDLIACGSSGSAAAGAAVLRILSACCHLCHGIKWQEKYGATRVLGLLVRRLPRSFLVAPLSSIPLASGLYFSGIESKLYKPTLEIEILKSLLAVLRETHVQSASYLTACATESISNCLKACHSNICFDDMSTTLADAHAPASEAEGQVMLKEGAKEEATNIDENDDEESGPVTMRDDTDEALSPRGDASGPTRAKVASDVAAVSPAARGPFPSAEELLDVDRDVTLAVFQDCIADVTLTREAAQGVVAFICRERGYGLRELWTGPWKENVARSLAPASRPLRTVPFVTQAGIVSMLCFVMSMDAGRAKPPLFTAREVLDHAPLKAIVAASIEIAEDTTILRLVEAEDAALIRLTENKLVDRRVAKALVNIKLTILQLFTVLMRDKAVFQSQGSAHAELLAPIVGVFFRALESRHEAIVTQACDGLRLVVAEPHVPKDILQANLRSILVLLSDYLKLSVNYLAGLSRVLELLSSWFNINLADKLLEHLQKWMEPEKLAAAKKWPAGSEIKVAVAILELFHLLPSGAVRFMEPLVHTVLHLEQVNFGGAMLLSSVCYSNEGLAGQHVSSSSPFRAALLKFCNRYASDAVDFFLRSDNLTGAGGNATGAGHGNVRNLFFAFLWADDGGPLRDALAGNTQKLIDATFKFKPVVAGGVSGQGVSAGASKPASGSLPSVPAPPSGSSQAGTAAPGVSSVAPTGSAAAQLLPGSASFASPNQASGQSAIPPLSSLTFCGIVVVEILSSRLPDWLAKQADVFGCLVDVWNNPDWVEMHIKKEDLLPVEQIGEAQTLAECILRYCYRQRGELAALFQLLSVFSRRSLRDFEFVKLYFTLTIPTEYSDAEKHAVLCHFLNLLKDTSVPQERKGHALTLLVLFMEKILSSMNAHDPATVTDVASAAEPSKNQIQVQAGADHPVVSADVIDRMVRELFDYGDESVSVPSAALSSTAAAEERDGTHVHSSAHQSGHQAQGLPPPQPFAAELLQLATLLIQNLPSKLVQYRKELIKFGWNHLKRDASVTKCWAFMNVCRFFEAYVAPDKIILQVYVALLRACQPEGRTLVRKALDVLTPVLPIRLPHHAEEHKYPIWIRYIKKMLVEEGHSLQHLVHIWQLLVRHGSLFYPARAQFVPQMVNSLQRLGLSPSTTTENRRLTVDLAELVIQWEKTRQAAAAAARSAITEPTNAPGYGEMDNEKDEAASATGSTAGGKRVRQEPEDESKSLDVNIDPLRDAPGRSGVERESSATDAQMLVETDRRPAKQLKDASGNAVPVPVPVTLERETGRGKVAGSSSSVSVAVDSNKDNAADVMSASPSASPSPSPGPQSPGSSLNHVKHKQGIALAAGASAAAMDDDFKPTSAMVEMIVNFLAKIAFAASVREERMALAERCCALISDALDLWPDTLIRLQHVEKILQSAAAAAQAAAVAAASAAAPAADRGGQNPSVGRMNMNIGVNPLAAAQQQRGQTASAVAASAAARGHQVDAGATKMQSLSGAASASPSGGFQSPVDVQAIEKQLVRQVSIWTSVKLCSVVLEKQGLRGAENNLGAFKAVFLPSFRSNAVGMPDVLVKLIAVLLKLYEEAQTKMDTDSDVTGGGGECSPIGQTATAEQFSVLKSAAVRAPVQAVEAAQLATRPPPVGPVAGQVGGSPPAGSQAAIASPSTLSQPIAAASVDGDKQKDAKPGLSVASVSGGPGAAASSLLASPRNDAGVAVPLSAQASKVMIQNLLVSFQDDLEHSLATLEHTIIRNVVPVLAFLNRNAPERMKRHDETMVRVLTRVAKEVVTIKRDTVSAVDTTPSVAAATANAGAVISQAHAPQNQNSAHVSLARGGMGAGVSGLASQSAAGIPGTAARPPLAQNPPGQRGAVPVSAAAAAALAHAAQSKSGSASGSSGMGVTSAMEQQTASLASPVRVTSAGSVAAAGAPGVPVQEQSEVSLLISIIRLLSERVSALDEHRKQFIQVLWALLERCAQPSILQCILTDCVAKWVTFGEASKVLPTSPLVDKEKLQFLNRMASFERLQAHIPGVNQLQASYLEVIYNLFAAPDASTYEDALGKLEKPFLIGTRSSDPQIRAKFTKLLCAPVGRTPENRLYYILAQQDWEHIADSFWIRQAVELLLDIVDSKVNLSIQCVATSDAVVRGVNGQARDCCAMDTMPDWTNDYDLDSAVGVVDLQLRERTSTVEFFLSCVRFFIHTDVDFCKQIWLSVFRAAWKTLPREDDFYGSGYSRSSPYELTMLSCNYVDVLASPVLQALIALIGKEYMLQQAGRRQNVVQCLVEGCAGVGTDEDGGDVDGESDGSLDLNLPAELLLYTAQKFGTWYVSIYLLESRLGALLRMRGIVSTYSSTSVGPSGGGGGADLQMWSSSTYNQIHTYGDVAMGSPGGGSYSPHTMGWNAVLEAEVETLQDVLCELYRLLNEHDMEIALWKQRTASSMTLTALFLEQRKDYDSAMRAYLESLSGAISSQGGLAQGEQQRSHQYQQRYSHAHARQHQNQQHVTLKEARMLEDKWIHCTKQLSHWDVLTEYSRSIVDTDLLHECLWRTPDWAALKELLAKHPIDDPVKLRLYQGFVQLQENKLENVTQLVEQASQKALEAFYSLPKNAGLTAYTPSLIVFQRLVELQESVRVISELNAANQGGAGVAPGVNTNTHPVGTDIPLDNIRQVLTSWRERLPAYSDAPLVWTDLLGWRQHIFTCILNTMQSLKETAGRDVPPPVLCLGVNETAWIVNKIGTMYRKKGLPESCLYVLMKMYTYPTMDVGDFFVKTKQQLKSYLKYPKFVDNPLAVGLRHANSCNIQHFPSKQKAKLFCLKGEFFFRLKQGPEASQAYTEALRFAADLSSSWLAWGQYCDAAALESAPVASVLGGMAGSGAGPETGTVSGGAATSAAGPAAAPRIPGATFNQQHSWPEATVTCYLMAVRFGSRRARMFISRVLRLLSLDSSSTADEASQTLVAQAILRFLDLFPNWAWLPWIHQLLPMLARREASVARDILVRIAVQYPQAVFYNLRSFLEERRPLDMKGTSGGSPTPSLVQEALQAPRQNVPPLLPTATQQMSIQQEQQLQAAQAAANSALSKFQQLQAHALQAAENVRQLESQSTVTAAAKQAARAAAEKAAQVASSAQKQASELANKATALQQRQNQMAQMTGLQPGGSAVAGAAGARAGVFSSAAAGVKAAGPAPTASVSGAVRAAGAAPSAVATGSSAGAVGSVATPGAATPSPPSVAAVSGKDAGAGTAQPSAPSPGTAPPSGVPRAGAPVSGASPPGSTSPGMKANVGPHATAASAQLVPKAAVSMDPNEAVALSIAAAAKLSASSAHQHAEIVMAMLIKHHQSLYVELERTALELSMRLKPQHEEQLLGLMQALLHRCYQLAPYAVQVVAPSIRSALEEVARMCFGTVSAGAAAPPASSFKIAPSIVDLKEAFEAELAPQTAKDFPATIEPFIRRLLRWKNIFQRRVDAIPRVQRLEHMSRYLLLLHESEVEVFGQYTGVDGSEPSPDLHIKIGRISANVTVMRHYNNASKRLELIGTDGNQYHFILETSVNVSTQRTEERAAQLYRLFNLLMENFLGRRYGWSDTGAARSSAELLQQLAPSHGEGHFQHSSVNIKTGAVARQDALMARLQAFNYLCERVVPETALLHWVQMRVQTAGDLFALRHSLAKSLGVSSLVNYMLAIGARRPQHMLISLKSGRIQHVQTRPLVSSRGLIECDEGVPFRLTRNFVRLLGDANIHGAFSSYMAAAVDGLKDSEQLVSHFLFAVLRDEFGASESAATVVSGPAAPSSTAEPPLAVPVPNPAQVLVEKRLAESVRLILKRLEPLPDPPTNADGVLQDLDGVSKKVSELVSLAGSAHALCQMDPSWHSWF